MLPLRALSLLSVVLFLPMVAADHWGVHEVAPGAEVVPPGEQGSYWICVQSVPFRPEVVLLEGPEAERVFRPSEDAADCRVLPGSALEVPATEAGAVRVLVLSKAPRDASGPGVFRLVSPGVSVAIDRLGPQAEIGVLRDGAGAVVEVVRSDTLEVVRTLDAERETRFGREGVGGETGLIIALVAAPQEGSALVDWVDPSWYRQAPTIGHIAVVVAIALFLMIYHGRSPRRLG